MNELEMLIRIQLKEEELIRNARAGKLLSFTKYTMPEYEISWHHQRTARVLNDFIARKIRRLMIFEPPRHGKSELTSRRLPALLHGLYPNDEILAGSYNSELAGDMTIDCQRIMDTKRYKDIFPYVGITADGSKGQYARNRNEHEIIPYRHPDKRYTIYKGSYRSAGVGGSFTGRGANWILLDDLVKNREDADSAQFREKVWKWYTSTIRTRLEGEGSICLTMCMVGSTSVLMADGTHRSLKDLKKGDCIATYDNGHIAKSTVLNWINQGPDVIYRITTKNGCISRANERHPFLVKRQGIEKWIRLRDLKIGDIMLTATAHGQVKNAPPMDVTSRSDVKDIATLTTIKLDGHQGTDRHHATPSLAEMSGSSKDMGSISRAMTGCSLPKKADVRSVMSSLESTSEHIGEANCVSTTITPQVKSEDYSAMTATSLSDMAKLQTNSEQQLSTYRIIQDEIVSIDFDGTEDVFDIQVDRTENFIADGLISHNTRWHDDDLAGRLLKLAKADPDADQWYVLNLPALKLVDGDPEDPRSIGEALWPTKFGVQDLTKIKASVGSREWSALYMQSPVTEGGNIIKSDWMRYYMALPQRFDEVIQSWDFATKDKDSSAYTVGQVWGRVRQQKYLIDQVRGRWSFPDACNEVVKLSKKHPYAHRKLVEAKANGPAVVQTLKKYVSGLVEVEPRGDKIARLNAVSPDFEAGNVELPHQSIAPWVTDYVLELISVPAAAHWDQADTTSQALDHLRKSGPTMAPITGHGGY